MSTYTVVGHRVVDGVAPGGTVTITDDARASGLVTAGHLALVKKKAAAAKPAAATKEA